MSAPCVGTASGDLASAHHTARVAGTPPPGHARCGSSSSPTSTYSSSARWAFSVASTRESPCVCRPGSARAEHEVDVGQPNHAVRGTAVVWIPRRRGSPRSPRPQTRPGEDRGRGHDARDQPEGDHRQTTHATHPRRAPPHRRRPRMAAVSTPNLVVTKDLDNRIVHVKYTIGFDSFDLATNLNYKHVAQLMGDDTNVTGDPAYAAPDEVLATLKSEVVKANGQAQVVVDFTQEFPRACSTRTSVRPTRTRSGPRSRSRRSCPCRSCARATSTWSRSAELTCARARLRCQGRRAARHESRRRASGTCG